MGKTSKPLKIYAYGGVESWEEVQALFAQGHEQVDSAERADVVWGPTAHRMSPHERPWLDDAVAEARRLKYGKREGGVTSLAT